MIEVIKSPQPFTEETQWTVFLAGPMNGAPSWQAQALKVAEKLGIENLTLLNPRKTDRFVSPTYQVNWETFGLRMCDVILFCIPPQTREMKPNRVYAITTRMEMAENLARGHKVIIGLTLFLYKFQKNTCIFEFFPKCIYIISVTFKNREKWKRKRH